MSLVSSLGAMRLVESRLVPPGEAWRVAPDRLLIPPGLTLDETLRLAVREFPAMPAITDLGRLA